VVGGRDVLLVPSFGSLVMTAPYEGPQGGDHPVKHLLTRVIRGAKDAPRTDRAESA
jgi:hypothetical protein